MTLQLMDLLRPGRVDPVWEAERAGWRCFVFGNPHSAYRRGGRLRAAWQRGFDGASRSPDPVRHIL